MSMIDEMSYLLGKQAGGGSRNTTETITGTLAAPWGDADLSALAAAVGGRNATICMTVDGSALGAGTFEADVRVKNGALSFSVANLSTAVVACCEANWDASDGTLLNAFTLRSTTKTDIASYAAGIPTSTVIVGHPLD